MRRIGGVLSVLLVILLLLLGSSVQAAPVQQPRAAPTPTGHWQLIYSSNVTLPQGEFTVDFDWIFDVTPGRTYRLVSALSGGDTGPIMWTMGQLTQTKSYPYGIYQIIGVPNMAPYPVQWSLGITVQRTSTAAAVTGNVAVYEWMPCPAGTC
jgi:hypothetical protein